MGEIVLKNEAKGLHEKLVDIRDAQRHRMDAIHALCHDLQRQFIRQGLRGQDIDVWMVSQVEQMHKAAHDFMWDFDKAVLIHERLAELEGRDPKEATRALWTVRTER